jgi:hypothetical protein
MHNKTANWLDDIKAQLESVKRHAAASPYAKGSLIGGAAGAALAGGASWQNSEDGDTPALRRRRILRDALMGGVLGAGAGAALPAFGDIAKQLAPPPTAEQSTAARIANIFADDKPLGGLTGTTLGGVGGFTAERYFRRGNVLDKVHSHLNGVLNGAHGVYKDITKAVADEMNHLKGTAIGGQPHWNNAFDELIHKRMEALNLDKSVLAPNVWSQRWKEQVKDWETEARKTHLKRYDPTLATFTEDFGRTPVANGISKHQGALFGGFGPQGFLGRWFSRATSPGGASADQLGLRLLREKNFTAAQAAAELEKIMHDPAKHPDFTRNMAKTYSGRGIHTGITGRSIGATALGAALPSIIPYAIPAVAAAKGLLKSTVSDQ